MDLPHALPQRIVSTCRPPRVAIDANDAGVRAKQVDLTMFRLYRCHHGRYGRLVAHVHRKGLSANLRGNGRDRIAVKVSDDDSACSLSNKTTCKRFANTAGATRYNTDLASDLHLYAAA
jgi:hypothetical protein